MTSKQSEWWSEQTEYEVTAVDGAWTLWRKRPPCKVAEAVTARSKKLLAIGHAYTLHLEAEVERLEDTFDLIQEAQERAIAAWRTATGAESVLPDWRKLTEWLLDCIIKHENAFTDLNAEWSEQHAMDIHLQREEAVRRDDAIARAEKAETERDELRGAVEWVWSGTVARWRMVQFVARDRKISIVEALMAHSAEVRELATQIFNAHKVPDNGSDL